MLKSSHQTKTQSIQKIMETAHISPLVKSFLAGSFSATCSTILFQPLDLVKTRVQLAGSSGKPQGIFNIVVTVVEKDRLIGLWRGFVPSIARCVPGVAIYFSSLHWLRTNYGNSNPHPLNSLALGATARTVAAVACIPFSVIKTRYESGNFQYSSVRKALFTICQKEGIRGLFSGLTPTLMRDVPYSALYFMLYMELKKTLPEDSLKDPFVLFMCGVSAGAIVSVVTQPPDVIKTHAQLNPTSYGSVRACVRHVYETDGFAGFWRGIIPRTVRRTLMTAMSWTIYEQAEIWLGLRQS